MEAAENETPRLEEFHVLQEFRDFFSDEILGIPPKETLISRLNLCQEKYTRNARDEDATARVVGEEVYQVECVSLGSTSSVCEKKRWYTDVVY